MRTWYGGQFDVALRRLQKHARVSVPVYVRTVPKLVYDGDELCGDCVPGFAINNHSRVVWYQLRVLRDMELDLAIDTLIHEWAHALDQDRYGLYKIEHHRHTWGMMYAYCYRAAGRED